VGSKPEKETAEIIEIKREKKPQQAPVVHVVDEKIENKIVETQPVQIKIEKHIQERFISTILCELIEKTTITDKQLMKDLIWKHVPASTKEIRIEDIDEEILQLINNDPKTKLLNMTKLKKALKNYADNGNKIVSITEGICNFCNKNKISTDVYFSERIQACSVCSTRIMEAIKEP
jgi:hypothetical protein